MEKRIYKYDIMTKERIVKHKIRQFNNMFERVVHLYLGDSEVFSGEARLMMEISHQDNITQKTLSTKVGTSAASVGVSLRKLEKKGYIFRKANDKDSRANLIVLTQKGEDFIENTHKIFQYLDKETFSGFSDEEKDVLDSFFDRLKGNLTKLLEEKQ